jgi:beta-glucuronidase
MRVAIVVLVFANMVGRVALAQEKGEALIANVGARTTTSLNGAWHYIVDPYESGLGARYYEDRDPRKDNALIEYDFAASPTLTVPGDWNSQREALFFYEGPIWYERKFEYKKAQGKRVFLYFGAANYWARVFLNGKKLGEHEGGFTPFNFEVTDGIAGGENSIVLEVDNARRADGVPALSTDWWNYGGLTRDVLLVETPANLIENYRVQLGKSSPNEIVGWVQVNGKEAVQKVSIEIPVAGVRQRVNTDASGRGEFRFAANVEKWSPEHPKLYRVSLSTAEDRVEEEIGFRSIETRGREILLNGKPIFLRGISMHEEAPIRGGRAYSVEDDRVLLNWTKELGCNFVRLAHYPYNQGMARLADQMGVLLWEEIPVYWGIAFENPGTLQTAESQMKELIGRDQNRASVILWSLSNETPPGAARLEFLKKFAEYTRTLDQTRLVTSAMNSAERTAAELCTINDALGEYLDVLGVNEYLGWYEGKPEDADKMQWRNKYDKPVIVSEFGGEALAGKHGDVETRWTEESQANLYTHQLRMMSQIPGLAGMSPWLLVDFRSPRRQLPGLQDYYNRKGLISNQGQKKQAFFVLQKYYAQRAASAN